jgi:hypothetical protein
MAYEDAVSGPDATYAQATAGDPSLLNPPAPDQYASGGFDGVNTAVDPLFTYAGQLGYKADPAGELTWSSNESSTFGGDSVVADSKAASLVDQARTSNDGGFKALYKQVRDALDLDTAGGRAAAGIATTLGGALIAGVGKGYFENQKRKIEEKKVNTDSLLAQSQIALNNARAHNAAPAIGGSGLINNPTFKPAAITPVATRRVLA